MEERLLGVNVDGQTAGRETELEVALESRTSINEAGPHQQGMTPETRQERSAGQPYEEDDAVAWQRMGLREEVARPSTRRRKARRLERGDEWRQPNLRERVYSA
jgi:hypothetical protein